MQALKPITKPTKQRKMLFQAPDHIRYKFFGAPLSPQLMKSHKVKAIPVRSGDTVRIMRGDHKGFEGKITRVDRRKYRIYVEGLTREKVDGTAVFVPVHPSKVMITNLNLDDKWRKKILERKKITVEKAEITPEKPLKPVIETKPEITEEKPKEKKPRTAKRKTAKPAAAKTEKEKTEKEEEKPKKPRTKRKTTKKSEGGA
jgi:large subunit ribosomal protein L24